MQRSCQRQSGTTGSEGTAWWGGGRGSARGPGTGGGPAGGCWSGAAASRTGGGRAQGRQAAAWSWGARPGGGGSTAARPRGARPASSPEPPGGVGSLAVQLARRTGATVIGLASESNHEWLKSHGVIPVAYGDGVADRIRAAPPSGVGAVIDTYGAGDVAPAHA